MKLWLLIENNAVGNIVNTARSARELMHFISNGSKKSHSFIGRVSKDFTRNSILKDRGLNYKIERIDLPLEDSDIKFALDNNDIDYIFDEFTGKEIAKYFNMPTELVCRHKGESKYWASKMREKLKIIENTFDNLEIEM